MDKTRSFLAIDFGSFYSEEIKVVVQSLKQHYTDVKWVNPEAMHLTLSFFGNVEQCLIDTASDILKTLAPRHQAFSLSLHGVGGFPDLANPRVLWAGLEGQTELLQALKKDLDAGLLKAGIAPEERDFHPHLTLGRLRGFKRQARNLPPEVLNFNSSQSYRVTRLVIFKSELTREGARYTPLRTFSLLPEVAANP